MDSNFSTEELARTPLAQVNGRPTVSMIRKPQVFKTPTSETVKAAATNKDRENNDTSPSSKALDTSISSSVASTFGASQSFNDENSPFPVMKRKFVPMEDDDSSTLDTSLNSSLNSSLNKISRRKVEPNETKKPATKSIKGSNNSANISMTSKFNNFSNSLRSSSTAANSGSRLNQSFTSSSLARTRSTSSLSSSTIGGAAPAKKSAVPTKKPVTASAGKRPAWDLKGRMEDMEALATLMKDQLRNQGSTVHTLTEQLQERERRLSVADVMQTSLSSEVETRSKDAETLATANRELVQTVTQLRAQHQLDTEMMQSKARQMQSQYDSTVIQLTNSQVENDTLKGTLAGKLAQLTRLQSQIDELNTKLETSESLCNQRQDLINQLEAAIRGHLGTIAELEEKARADENIRRQLHNHIQELKGNIRVFCRVRPGASPSTASSEEDGQIAFPANTDGKALEIVFNTGAGVTGKSTQDKKMSFKFDKVFQPASTQRQVFDEISQLVQSVLDGYNTCIFTYGQTGSGKTFTMEGPAHSLEQASLGINLSNDDQRGMIPRTVEQIFASSKALESKGWRYEMEAFFLEIYNESIRDLLCSKSVAADTKYDIKHDASGTTSVTNMTVVKVSHPSQVYDLLQTASKNRAVGKTNCNERSSRSHSVFQLQLRGHNTITDERTQGILNLIDLAGSERISQSGVTGDRLKETQAINKSLSSLADVICALSNKEPHIPYRNSKLTFLLQNCLGGNSKTLMFVNVSPENKDLNESISSLRFATKVNACEIGTARKGGKVDLKL